MISLQTSHVTDSDSPNHVLEESVPHKDSSMFSPMFRISKEVDESRVSLTKILQSFHLKFSKEVRPA
jgi:hypothetical protein